MPLARHVPADRPQRTSVRRWTVRVGKPYDERGMRLVATERGVVHVGRSAPRSTFDLGGTR